MKAFIYVIAAGLILVIVSAGIGQAMRGRAPAPLSQPVTPTPLSRTAPPTQVRSAPVALPTVTPDQRVTLKAFPGNTEVQMFEVVGDGPNDVVTFFPSGTRCTKISGPSSVSVAGISMRFYNLECNGTTGYVNAKWVSE